MFADWHRLQAAVVVKVDEVAEGIAWFLAERRPSLESGVPHTISAATNPSGTISPLTDLYGEGLTSRRPGRSRGI